MLKITKITNGHLDLTTGEQVGPSAIVGNDAGHVVSIPLDDPDILQRLAKMWVHDNLEVDAAYEKAPEYNITASPAEEFANPPQFELEDEPDDEYENDLGVASL